MSEQRRGVIFGASAYGLWGLIPLYWPLLEPAGSLEILAHRFVWSLVFVVAVLLLLPRPGWWRALRRRPGTLAYLSAAAVAISVNWGTYIFGVTHGRVVETSLGYYINPLVTVLAGVVIFGERLRRPQWYALGVAGAAVLILAVGYGQPPWVALVLAFSFATYGLLKKKAVVPAVEGLAVETAVVAPVAVGYLCWLEWAGRGGFGHTGVGGALLFAGTGLVTAIPLLLFASAALRLPMTTLGVLQYLAPTLQFVLGVAAFHEPMPAERLLGFALVWLALAIFTIDALSHRRRRYVVAEVPG